jgi:hypothetical protein
MEVMEITPSQNGEQKEFTEEDFAGWRVIEFVRKDITGSNTPTVALCYDRATEQAYSKAERRGGVSEIPITFLNKRLCAFPGKVPSPSASGLPLFLKYLGNATLPAGLAIFVAAFTTLTLNLILLGVGLVLIAIGVGALYLHGRLAGHD